MEDLCFGSGRSRLSQATYQSVLLATGGMVKTLVKHGQHDTAAGLVHQFHQELGIHGGFLLFRAYRNDMFIESAYLVISVHHLILLSHQSNAMCSLFAPELDPT